MAKRIRAQAAIESSCDSASSSPRRCLMHFAGAKCTSTARPLSMRGQATSENMMIFAAALLILLFVLAIAVIWPSFVNSVDSQKSAKYWSAAKPFAVSQSFIYPERMVIEIRNSEPVSLTVKSLYVNGQNFTFSNHSIPFDWETVSPRCAGGVCNMTVRAGEVQIISTDNLSSLSSNPCVSGSEFVGGAKYQVDLALSYNADNSSQLENQTGAVKLVGECIAQSTYVCNGTQYNPPAQRCCNSLTIYYSATQKCCTDVGTYICPIAKTCFGGACANLCNGVPYVAPNACCGGTLIYDASTYICCTDYSPPYTCTIAPPQGCDGGTCIGIEW